METDILTTKLIEADIRDAVILNYSMFRTTTRQINAIISLGPFVILKTTEMERCSKHNNTKCTTLFCH